MRHAVENVVKPHAECHGCEGFRVIWVVGPLPCITQVHVVADGDNYAPLIIADGTPFGLISVFLVVCILSSMS
jgi:hypothetical protein